MKVIIQTPHRHYTCTVNNDFDIDLLYDFIGSANPFAMKFYDPITGRLDTIISGELLRQSIIFFDRSDSENH